MSLHDDTPEPPLTPDEREAPAYDAFGREPFDELAEDAKRDEPEHFEVEALIAFPVMGDSYTLHLAGMTRAEYEAIHKYAVALFSSRQPSMSITITGKPTPEAVRIFRFIPEGLL